MDKALPFEYGVLYKPVAEHQSKYGNNWITMYDQKTVMNNDNYNNSYQYDYPTANINAINWNYYFLPIAFIESQQKVVGEVYAEEQKRFIMLVPSQNGYGINFNKDTITERATKLFRVELNANEFITNFEKVL